MTVAVVSVAANVRVLRADVSYVNDSDIKSLPTIFGR